MVCKSHLHGGDARFIESCPPGLIRYGCGSELRGTGFEPRPCRMFVIVVHIYWSKLFKDMECAVGLTAHYKHDKESKKSFEESRV